MDKNCRKTPKEPDFLKDNPGAKLHWKMRNIEHSRMMIINTMLARHDICYTHPRILGDIMRHGSVTQTEIANRMNISTAAMSSTIKVLQKQGLVKKDTDSNDLRYNKISLTEKGKKMHDETLSQMLKIDKEMLSGFTDEEAQLFLTMLDKVQLNLNKLSEGQEEKDD